MGIVRLKLESLLESPAHFELSRVVLRVAEIGQVDGLNRVRIWKKIETAVLAVDRILFG